MHRYIRLAISLFHNSKTKRAICLLPVSPGLAFEELRHVSILRRIIQNKDVTF